MFHLWVEGGGGGETKQSLLSQQKTQLLGKKCHCKHLLTLFMSCYLTNRKDQGAGRGGMSAPPCHMAIGGCFHYFLQTGILSWMKRTIIQKHSHLPLKFTPSESFEKFTFLAKIQQNRKFAILLFIQKSPAKIKSRHLECSSILHEDHKRHT